MVDEPHKLKNCLDEKARSNTRTEKTAEPTNGLAVAPANQIRITALVVTPVTTAHESGFGGGGKPAQRQPASPPIEISNAIEARTKFARRTVRASVPSVIAKNDSNLFPYATPNELRSLCVFRKVNRTKTCTPSGA
jgi:hypothetical protein